MIAARRAQAGIGRGRLLPAIGAQPPGAALGGLATAALPSVSACLLAVAARFAGGPEPRVPDPAGNALLLGAGRTHAELGRGRLLPALRAQALGGTLGGAPVVACAVGGTFLPGAGLALAAQGRGRLLLAFQAQTLGAALGGAPVVALQVARAPDLEVLVGHRGVLPAGVGIQAKDARPALGALGRPDARKTRFSPSACGRRKGLSPRCPSTGPRCS